jgi:hypothetical protein
MLSLVLEALFNWSPWLEVSFRNQSYNHFFFIRLCAVTSPSLFCRQQAAYV